MRIEKINEKQIRCTLNSSDLSDRELNINELAYGSDKARSLFREMLIKASTEYGFHADNIPLMIEAVPLPEDSIMLLITKVEDPDELDTRFSRFAPSSSEDYEDVYDDFSDSEEPIRGADEILSQIQELCLEKNTDSEGGLAKEAAELDFFRVFLFPSLEPICRAARVLCQTYDADNSLYKDPINQQYYLVLHKGQHSPETFNKICNILSEYGTYVKGNSGSEGYYDEHFEHLVKNHAIQTLERF